MLMMLVWWCCLRGDSLVEGLALVRSVVEGLSS